MYFQTLTILYTFQPTFKNNRDLFKNILFSVNVSGISNKFLHKFVV